MKIPNIVGASSGYLSLPQVLDLIPVARSTLYGWIAKGVFPPPCKLGPRRVGWRRQDIDMWCANRDATR